MCGQCLLWTSFGCQSPALGLCWGQPATDPVVRPSRRFLSERPGSRAAYQGAHRPRVSVVGPQSANLGVHSCASGEPGAAFPCSQSRAEGGGVPEAEAAAESSLTSYYVPLFSFPFWEILPIQAPLVQTSTWLLTQPSLALSQESCSRPCIRAGASAALVPARVPGTLLSLNTLLTV